jgi:ribosomal protein S18 acetylase RimI-like enzyme
MVSAELVLRDLVARDVEAAVEIAVAAWEPINAHHREVLGDALFAATRPDWRTEKARAVRTACQPNEGRVALVAEVEGQVVAFLTFTADQQNGVGAFTNNAVSPEHQGQGIGSRLYAYALQRMRELGLRYARVTTGGDAAHAPARRAYERAGFVQKLTSVEYYREL